MSDGTTDGSPPITVNGQVRALPGAGTLVAVLEEAGVADRPVAVEVDGEIVPRHRFADRFLVGGERIEIVTFVGGG